MPIIRRVRPTKRSTRKTKQRTVSQRKQNTFKSNPRPKTTSMPSRAPALARQICSVTDPFCTAAYGAKFPDQTSARTVAFQVRQYVAVLTDANGLGAVAFSADPAEGYKPAATWSGGAVTTWAVSNAYTTAANLVSAGAAFRPVSMGIRAVSTQASNNNTGILGIIAITGTGVQNNGKVSLSSVDTGATSYAANTRVPMNNAAGLIATARHDAIVSKNFAVPATGSYANNTITDWGTDVLIAYVVNGTPSVPVAQVEVIINYEATFESSSFYNTLATVNPPAVPAVQQGQNSVVARVPQVVVGGPSDLERLILGHAKDFAIRAAAGLAGFAFGGPAGAAVGMELAAAFA